MGFEDEQTSRLLASGWVTCPPIAEAVSSAGLPPITPRGLQEIITTDMWRNAEGAARALTKKFRAFRFADDAEYGILLVPNPSKLDTRSPMSKTIRTAQHPALGEDAFDDRLPRGARIDDAGRDWTVVVTVVGVHGPAAGSWDAVTSAADGSYEIDGVDSRLVMTRQCWGARVLQSGSVLPDTELSDAWTFTLFPAEKRVDGQAESGTILKGRVRFRLGKSDRGIGSARIAPGIVISHDSEL